MFTAILNPTFTDIEFDRLFNDSWSKMSDQFHGQSLEVTKVRIKNNFRLHGCIVATYEDGYLLSLYAGDVVDSVAHFMVALIGRNQAGSKSYLYDPEWLRVAEDLNKQNFTSIEFGTQQGSSMDNHVEAKKTILENAYGEPVKDSTVVTGSTAYSVKGFES